MRFAIVAARMKGAGVLIVDDDDSIRDLFTRALAGQGFVVRAVASGQEALQLIAHDLPRLIVLDLMMPGINGIEVLATIRQQPQTAAVPVLVTTATATSEGRGFRCVWQPGRDAESTKNIVDSLKPGVSTRGYLSKK